MNRSLGFVVVVKRVVVVDELRLRASLQALREYRLARSQHGNVMGSKSAHS